MQVFHSRLKLLEMTREVFFAWIEKPIFDAYIFQVFYFVYFVYIYFVYC